jgi:hypothetical protein
MSYLRLAHDAPAHENCTGNILINKGVPVEAPMAVNRPGYFCLGDRLPVGKYYFRGEHRTPLARGGAVVIRAADEFVAAVKVADEARGAELRDEVAAPPAIGPEVEVNHPMSD